MQWRDMMVSSIPELQWLHAIPNGAKLPFRNKSMANGRNERVCPQALVLKREGLTPGVYDMFLPVPRGHFHGLYIEHKAHRGTLSEAQQEFGAHAWSYGYDCCLSDDAQDTIDHVLRYWRLGPFKPAP